MATIVNIGTQRCARTRLLGQALLCAWLGSGCYVAEVDPDAGGVFACGAANESLCPGALVCVNDRCEDADLVPSLQILAPEDEAVVENDRVVELGMPGVMPGAPVEIVVNIQGTLALVSASGGAEHAFGEGHVKVLVDDVEQATIDEGAIDGSTPVTVQVPSTAGAHRILAQAYRNDGEPYDNAESTATRLFWLTSPLIERPFVAIKSPWPGTLLDVDSQEVEVEIATLRFTIELPGETPEAGHGHAHIYYDTPIPQPECVRDPACDDDYLGVITQPDPAIGTFTMPMATAGSGTLSVVLRDIDHSPYGLPFGCEPTMDGPMSLCGVVFDQVDVVRVDL